MLAYTRGVSELVKLPLIENIFIVYCHKLITL